jgi:hypothetical protein
MRKPLMMIVTVAGLTMAAEAATAQTVASSVRSRAPAPLLAAGIPAFVALGGATVVGRFVRRRKANTRRDEIAPVPDDAL